MKYGLLGKKIPYSKSPTLHSKFGDYEYGLIELEEDQLPDFFKKRSFNGINVTIPYKLEAYKYCDELSEAAQSCGCVNTVIKRSDGTLYGDNTDTVGFMKMLSDIPTGVKGKKAVVFGTGGAFRAVRYALEKREIGQIISVSRTGEYNYSNISEYSDAEILINTTPLGTYPNEDGCVVNADKFPKLEAALDLVYNPPRTYFLQSAAKVGAYTRCGLDMLVYQGLSASELFFERRLSEKHAITAYKACLDDMLNIVFIGMPGCGKSTLGKAIAEHFRMEFIDTDRLIEKKYNRSCSDIITSCGEPYFRRLEEDAVKEATAQRRSVISVGGGAILSEENRRRLRACGFVIHIIRPLESLSSEGRPLSKSPEEIKRLWQVRKPYYEACRDVEFIMENRVDKNTERLIEIINEKNTCY